MNNLSAFYPMYESAKKWVVEAGSRLEPTSVGFFEVEHKTSAADLVTEKDREIETFFISQIRNHYPSHFVLGEEGVSNQQSYDPRKETVWIIDPIDGTTNFVHMRRSFSISVALYDKGKPVFGLVYDPIAKELFHAFVGQGAYLDTEKLKPLDGVSIEEGVISINPLWLVPNDYVDFLPFQPLVQQLRGVRYIGSAALELAYVACGRLDAYLDFRLSPWDIAAGLIILKEVHAITTTMDNREIDVFNKSTTFTAKPVLHEQILATLGNKNE
jgi:myo-inositol-1(or 4)-monophosphatase